MENSEILMDTGNGHGHVFLLKKGDDNGKDSRRQIDSERT